MFDIVTQFLIDFINFLPAFILIYIICLLIGRRFR